MADFSDPEYLAQFERRLQILDQDKIEALAFLLGTYGGRALIWELLSEGGIYSVAFHGENTHHTAFEAGKRDMALKMLEKVMAAAPDAMTKMAGENSERQEYLDNLKGEDNGYA